jgi:hypothetical protein
MLFDKVLQQFLDNDFKSIYYILHSHVDLHFLEDCHFRLDILHHIQFLHNLFLSINWNIFNVDHHLIDRYVVRASYS